MLPELSIYYSLSNIDFQPDRLLIPNVHISTGERNRFINYYGLSPNGIPVLINDNRTNPVKITDLECICYTDDADESKALRVKISQRKVQKNQTLEDQPPNITYSLLFDGVLRRAGEKNFLYTKEYFTLKGAIGCLNRTDSMEDVLLLVINADGTTYPQILNWPTGWREVLK